MVRFCSGLDTDVQCFQQSRQNRRDKNVCSAIDIYARIRHMITREQLSELLRRVDAKAVADEAGVNVKTIYRLRHGLNSPRLEMVERLVAACRKLKGRKP